MTTRKKPAKRARVSKAITNVDELEKSLGLKKGAIKDRARRPKAKKPSNVAEWEVIGEPIKWQPVKARRVSAADRALQAAREAGALPGGIVVYRESSKAGWWQRFKAWLKA